MTMTLDAIRDGLPDVARDIKLNLGAVLGGGALAAEQRWGVAIAAALAARDADLAHALQIALPAETSAGIVEDARAAATLMAMTNVFYRFRHLVDKPAYADLPARLRMNRLGQPASSKINLELFSLAVSAMAGCETCVQAHERTVIDGGLTPEQVVDAIRIAATVNALATARVVGTAA
jgi:alkyl hydroperoxide reductase subunit D